jgi:hypothetical protein
LATRLETTSNLRMIAGLLVMAEWFPLKEGTLDVYALVKRGEIPRSELRILQKNGVPTAAEIDGGDYSRFPYHRYQGEGKPDYKRRIPLLWEKEPDSEGMFVVAFNDGSASAVDRAELDRLLLK